MEIRNWVGLQEAIVLQSRRPAGRAKPTNIRKTNAIMSGSGERVSNQQLEDPYTPLPPATVLKLEPPPAVYRVFRLVSSPPNAHAAQGIPTK